MLELWLLSLVKASVKDAGALWGKPGMTLESASHAVFFPSDTKKIYRAQESALK